MTIFAALLGLTVGFLIGVAVGLLLPRFVEWLLFTPIDEPKPEPRELGPGGYGYGER